MATADAKLHPRPGRSLSTWFWGGFIAVLLVGLLIGVFAAIRGAKQWAERSVEQSAALPAEWKEVIRVTLSGGEALYIDSASLPRIRHESSAWLAQRRELAEEQLSGALEQGSEAIFAAAAERIPAFADWYYSLSGEYTRLFHAAVGDLPEYLTGRLEELIFAPAGTAAGIDGLVEGMDKELAQRLSGAAVDFRSLLTRLVRSQRVEEETTQLRVSGQWAPGRGLTERLKPLVTLSTADIARQGAATSAGVAASAVAFKKLGAASVAKSATLIAGKQSAGMLAALASKLGLKAALKSGSALTGAGAGAASGAAICVGSVVGAPAAPGCALVGGAVTGVATWLLVDKAVLEADELLHREQLEQQLREALAAQREELRAGLQTHYLDALHSGFEQLEQGISAPPRPAGAEPKRDFVPARAALGE